ncbi:aldo/keto reductase [Serpentinicella alkaliphila]|uniref:Aryl-alcohol dehydrogenase-like predicted oxidoreductase n=1 Tax=Serpentinicella alkaliphila TaxID=1734049 RepID=A0A4R2TSI7_9FIRM|nr:aldo/keto reductase [Serpentinicella alkaliphila]QUH26683.1 aldo/keto reductase [Serpentinicella alkaliphila]TCQ00519.1 aryl-alcohol dehydrogenase-like predicted oxidoreductase [Serpentinicella alkaliphila]
MERYALGNSGINVSKLCFGSLTMGPLQVNMSPEEGGKLLIHGYEKGINFVDTAELYGTYEHIKYALKEIKREEYVIATKSYSYDYNTAEKSLSKALKEMNTDYIDIFLLHEQESEHTLRGHVEAFEYFLKMKEKGYIRALGISSHTIAAVKASLKIKEIEILHPIVNMSGLGIQDGTIESMISVLNEGYNMGKGIYGMKPLGGGHLIKKFKESFGFILAQKYLHSIAIGMQSMEEIDVNVNIVNNRSVDSDIMIRLMQKTRKLIIHDWCEQCGNCIKACRHGALIIEEDELKVDHNKCVLCGYCSKYCPQFCLKVI